MAEKIRIAELSIDSKEIIKSLQDTKQSIESLTKAQRDLKNAGETSSEQFIRNESNLKSLKSEYTAQTKALRATTDATSKLNKELNSEVKSIAEATANNKALRDVRNQLDTSTKEGAKSLEAINKKLDANNNFIKENTSSLEQQKQNIGNYPDVLDKVTGGLGGMVKGFMSVTKATLSFLATPIGAVLGLIAGTFLLVKSAMDRSEESTNKVKRAFAGFQGIISAVTRVVEPLGKFLIDGLVKGFELVEKGVFKAINGIARGLELLGFDEQAKSMRNFNAEVQQGSKDAKALADAEAQLTKSQREARKIQLDYQKDAEKLRQIRDDESKSMAERIAANNELGATLDKQLQSELAIANQALEVARLRLIAEGESSEALDAQAAALENISDIQERVTSQESEQLTNRNSLYKEASENAKQVSQERIEQAKLEIELTREKNRELKISDDERLEQVKTYAEEDKKILKDKLDAKLISETEYQLGLAQIDNDVEAYKDEKEQKELDRIASFEEKKKALEDEIALGKIEDAFEKEELRIEQEYEKQALELERLQLNEEQKTELMLLLQEQRDLALAENAEKAAQDMVSKVMETNQKIIESEKTAAQERQNIANFLTGAIIGFLGDSLAAKLGAVAIEGAMQAGLVAIEGAAAAGKITANIAAANAAAISASPLTAGLPFTAINTAQGTSLTAANSVATKKAIGKILGATAIKGLGVLSTAKFADGGVLNGASHANGGIKTPYGELEGGEAIINKRSTAMYAPFLSAINQAGGGVKFANGGIAGGASLSNKLIDYDLLAIKVAEANLSLPNPIVGVDEISAVGNRVSVIQSQANF